MWEYDIIMTEPIYTFIQVDFFSFVLTKFNEDEYRFCLNTRSNSLFLTRDVTTRKPLAINLIELLLFPK